MSTVPQVFINGDHIGGSEDLEAYLASAAKSAA
jgi:glutaredoxin